MERRTVEQMERDNRARQILDLRSTEEYRKETLPGAENLRWEDLDEQMDRVAKDRPVYLLCYTGQKSDEIAERLTAEGYEAYSIDDGWHGWLRLKLQRMLAGQPVWGEDVRPADAGNKTQESGRTAEASASGAAEQTQESGRTAEASASGAAEQMPESAAGESRARQAERSIIKTFRKEIWRRFTSAINEYQLIRDGDRIAVCISGGKDSMLMAKLFQELARHGKHNFELVFLVMNPGYNAVNYETILHNAELLEVPITVFTSEIFDIVAGEGNSPCYLCARMRRGYLYAKAKELGCNKIALGHHYDDVIETILMGMLYGGQIQTMMPKLHSTNFEGMELIRPLYLIRERDIIRWMNYNHLQFIQCACRFTENCASCGGTEKGSKRAEIKRLIRALAQNDPIIEKNIFKSVENVTLDTVIAYKQKGVRHHFLDDYDGKTVSATDRSAEDTIEREEENEQSAD